MNNPHKNWNCSNDRCIDPDGEVRIYPLGGDGNLILCRECVAHENAYRRGRGRYTGNPKAFPTHAWKDLEVFRP